MTDQETIALLSFLTGGCLAGVVGHWLDQVTTYVKGRG